MVTKECKECGIEFWVYPSNNRVYCSRSCNGKNSATQFITGETHPMWRGDRVGITAMHTWLKSHYGKADHCENPDCLGLSITFEWSKLRGKEYERKRENFWQLCKKCHVIYDYTDETRRKIGLSSIGRTHTVDQAGRKRMSEAAKVNYKKRKRNKLGQWT